MKTLVRVALVIAAAHFALAQVVLAAGREWWRAGASPGPVGTAIWVASRLPFPLLWDSPLAGSIANALFWGAFLAAAVAILRRVRRRQPAPSN